MDPSSLIRPARAEELVVVLDLLSSGAAFARAQGYDQWPARFEEQFVLEGIARGAVHLVLEGGVARGCFWLTWEDQLFWGSADDGSAGYLHRLAVAEEARGQGLGRLILDWAAAAVLRARRTRLRLDCLAANRRLRDWYEAYGFQHQGDTVIDPPGTGGRGPRRLLASLYQKELPSGG